jgi:glycosyltransferase involved in cell wall biosynthesis
MRILFVALCNSIHTARWLNQLVNEKWDVHLFSTDESGIHESLQDVTVHALFRKPLNRVDSGIRQTGLRWPLPRGKGRAERLLNNSPLQLDRAARLARVIRSLKPDIVHTMEMQRAGYLTLASFSRFGRETNFPPSIYSCWGSDLFHFGRKPEHEDRIRRFLSRCDYYIADCHRDVALARQFGFYGEVLGVFPVGGGFDIDRIVSSAKPNRPSTRKVIALKGYDGGEWGGRAGVALDALYLCQDQLRGYEIIVYSGSETLKQRAERIRELNFTFANHFAHSNMFQLFARSRLAISLAITDGTPNSMLEAMIMGAFPIQSDTISTAEWIQNGCNGLLVPPEDPQVVAEAITRALSDDTLVDNAALNNGRITRERVDKSFIQPQVIAMYKRVAEEGNSGRVQSRRRLPHGQQEICAS